MHPAITTGFSAVDPQKDVGQAFRLIALRRSRREIDRSLSLTALERQAEA